LLQRKQYFIFVINVQCIRKLLVKCWPLLTVYVLV